MNGKVLVIGLGLIGGSIAKALKIRGFEIHAYDINDAYLQSAINDGTIKAYLTCLDDIKDLYDFIFICTPVLESINILQTISHIIKDGIITDVGSTKSSICEFAIKNDIKNFIGGHPMAGTEKIGYDNSFETLFEGAYYFVTPTPINSDKNISKLKNLLKSLNCRVEEIDYKQHDFIAGVISHLPHIASAALVNMLKSDEDLLSKFAGGGFKDITRISSSSPKMWSDISFANKDVILHLTNEYIKLLETFKKELEDDNYQSIFDYFDHAKKIRDRIVSDKR